MFEVIFILTFLVISSVIIYAIYTSYRNWKYNNSQPKIAVEAFVVTKRNDQSMRRHTNTNHFHRTTYYYLTFEFSTGDRKEFEVDSSEFALLRENDTGVLTFQGNRFIRFERKIN